MKTISMSPNNPAAYNPNNDPMFMKPYIDIDEWKNEPLRFHYIHGGFEGTDTRFAFYFPDSTMYKQRFYHFMSPVPGNENAAMAGDCGKICFAVKNGAYFVESNMGVTASFGAMPDPTIIYKSSAAVAEYSRQVAMQFYGPHRQYGYVYGGSGGGYKTISCIENTTAWDGAVPFVIGSPISVPYSLMIASHCTRILRHKLPMIIDSYEPGGSNNPFPDLNKEESNALRELLRFGVNPRSLFVIKPGHDGSLPVLAPGVKSMDPSYFTDFWNEAGYLGADINGTAVRDRLQFKSKVVSLTIPEATDKQNWEDRTGVDDAWQRLLRGGDCEDISISLSVMPEIGTYIDGAELRVISGALSGRTLPIKKINESSIVLGGVFGSDDFVNDLSKIKPDDEVMLDNSDYIAIQTYYRHQIPESDYSIYDQHRDENGNPLYPQRSFKLGSSFAQGGAGSLQTGNIHGKVIVVSALLDGNLPWQADWYRRQVNAHIGDSANDHFRLWYVDNAVHSDEQISGDELHIAGYFGVLHQALLDLSDWVERDIAPGASTHYLVEDGQIIIPLNAKERMGIQPVVNLRVNGNVSTQVDCGEVVSLEASIEIPDMSGTITYIEWSLEGESDFPYQSETIVEKPDLVTATIKHSYKQCGTFFPVVKVSINRNGDANDPFTQVKNLCRARIVVT